MLRTIDTPSSRRTERPDDLEPRVAPVLAIVVPEFIFENPGFPACAFELHRDDEKQNQQKDWLADGEGESAQSHCAEHVHRIANFGIQTARDQLSGSRSDGKRIPELQAGSRPQNQAGNHDNQAEDVQGSQGSWMDLKEDVEEPDRHDQQLDQGFDSCAHSNDSPDRFVCAAGSVWL